MLKNYILGGKINYRCRKNNLIPPDQGWTKSRLLSDQGSEKNIQPLTKENKFCPSVYRSKQIQPPPSEEV